MYESWPAEAADLWQKITSDSRCVLSQCDVEYYHPNIPKNPPHELWVAVWNRSRTTKHPMIRVKSAADGSLAISLRVGLDSGLIGHDRVLKPIKGNPSDAEYGQRRVSMHDLPDDLFNWIRQAAIFTFAKHKVPLNLADHVPVVKTVTSTAQPVHLKSGGRKILVYGNSDSSEEGFPTTEHLVEYIKSGIFSKEHGRYRYSQSKDADVIVLSRNNVAYGHFDIEEKVKPTAEDLESYSGTKSVYLVGKSILYSSPVLLSVLSIKVGSYGTSLTEDQFQQLISFAGEVTESCGGVTLPTSTIELERILREVLRRLGQSTFRESLIEAYGGKCVVTGCDAVDALEAAHIVPYCDSGSSAITHGLLMRADIHTLFDRHLLGVNPTSLIVEIADQLKATSYSELDGVKLQIAADCKASPDNEALKTRWKKFKAQGQQTEQFM